MSISKKSISTLNPQPSTLNAQPSTLKQDMVSLPADMPVALGTEYKINKGSTARVIEDDGKYLVPPRHYRGISLIRNRHPVGPYRRALPRLLWRS